MGVIEGSKRHPPSLPWGPPVLISLVPRHGLSISSSSSRARSGGACLLDIALTLRFPTGEEVGDGPYLDRLRKAKGVHLTEFAGRTAVVTGGGSGMGSELVRQLVAEACKIAM